MNAKTMAVFATLFLIASWLGIRITQQEIQPADSPWRSIGQVAYIIDGDTLELARGERVRLIGIDAPEHGEPGFRNAKKALAELLPLGTRVTIEPGKDTYDRYGRMLVYLHHDGTLINEAMLEQGWAIPMTITPNTKYQERFAQAHAQAQEHQLGLFFSSE